MVQSICATCQYMQIYCKLYVCVCLLFKTENTRQKCGKNANIGYFLELELWITVIFWIVLFYIFQFSQKAYTTFNLKKKAIQDKKKKKQPTG